MKAGWELKRLDALCSVKTGRKDVNQGNSNGQYPFYTCARQHTYSDNYSFDGEAILIAGNGDVGNLSYYKGKFEAYQRTYVLMDFQYISANFLQYVFEHDLKPKLFDQKLGTAIPYIKKGMLTEMQIPLPPLEEQKRIVSILDEAFEGLERARENAEANLKNARELYRACLTNLTIRSVDAKEIPLVDAIVPSSSITYGVVKPGPEGNVPFVRGGDLQDGQIKIDQLRTITKDVSTSYKRTELEGGELLLCLVGQPGQTGVVPKSLKGANIARQTALIRLSQAFDAEFVSFFLLSKEGQSRLGAYTRGSVQQVINLSELKTVLIPKLDVSAQREIADKCKTLRSVVSSLTKYHERKLQDISDLRQSLLQKAFAGELT